MTQHARWLAGLVLIALGCDEDEDLAGTDVGNPVVLALRAEPADGLVRDGTDARYSLVAASGQVREVQLRVAGGLACADLAELPGGVTCSDGPTRLSISGSVTADLVAGTLSPEARVPPVDYAEASLLAGPSASAQGLILELTSEDGGRDVRVEVDPTAQLSFGPVEGEAAAFLAEPSGWLSGVDLMGCAGDQPGQGPLRVVVNPNDGACTPSQGR